MNRRAFLLVPALLACRPVPAGGLAFLDIHLDLWSRWNHQAAVDVCGLLVCYRTLSTLRRELSGNCVDWALVVLDDCIQAGLSVEAIRCRANGVAHMIIHHPESGLVSDNQLRFPRTLQRRIDLTEHEVVWRPT